MARIQRATEEELRSSGSNPSVGRVQTSLYSRLRPSWGASPAGQMSWCLVRASLPLHKGHEAACLDLADTAPDDLRELLEVARKTAARAPLTDPCWKRLADDIVATVSAEIGRRKGAIGRLAEATQMLADGVDRGDVAEFLGAEPAQSMITREMAEADAATGGAGHAAIYSSNDGWYVSSPASRARDPEDADLYERHMARAGEKQ